MPSASVIDVSKDEESWLEARSEDIGIDHSTASMKAPTIEPYSNPPTLKTHEDFETQRRIQRFLSIYDEAGYPPHLAPVPAASPTPWSVASPTSRLFPNVGKCRGGPLFPAKR